MDPGGGHPGRAGVAGKGVEIERLQGRLQNLKDQTELSKTLAALAKLRHQQFLTVQKTDKAQADLTLATRAMPRLSGIRGDLLNKQGKSVPPRGLEGVEIMTAILKVIKDAESKEKGVIDMFCWRAAPPCKTQGRSLVAFLVVLVPLLGAVGLLFLVNPLRSKEELPDPVRREEKSPGLPGSERGRGGKPIALGGARKSARLPLRAGLEARWKQVREFQMFARSARRQDHEGKEVGRLVVRVVGPDGKPLPHIELGVTLKKKATDSGGGSLGGQGGSEMTITTDAAGIGSLPVVYRSAFDGPGGSLELMALNPGGFVDEVRNFTYDQLFGWQKKVELRFRKATFFLVKVNGLPSSFYPADGEYRYGNPGRGGHLTLGGWEILEGEDFLGKKRTLYLHMTFDARKRLFRIGGVHGGRAVGLMLMEYRGLFEPDTARMPEHVRVHGHIISFLIRAPLPRIFEIPMVRVAGKGWLDVGVDFPFKSGLDVIGQPRYFVTIAAVHRPKKTQHVEDEFKRPFAKLPFALDPGRYIVLLHDNIRPHTLPQKIFDTAVVDIPRDPDPRGADASVRFRHKDRLGVGVLLRCVDERGKNHEEIAADPLVPVPDAEVPFIPYMSRTVKPARDGTFLFLGLPPGGKLRVWASKWPSKGKLVTVDLPRSPGAIERHTLTLEW